MFSSHLSCSLHRSKDAPRSPALPTACIEPPLSAISGHPLPVSALCHSSSRLLGLVSLRNLSVEALVSEYGAGPCTSTCQCQDPLEPTGTTHQWPGAEQLYQLSLGKLRYPVILAVWSLKLSPIYYSLQNQGPAKLNRALPKTFMDWVEKEALMWREAVLCSLLFFWATHFPQVRWEK